MIYVYGFVASPARLPSLPGLEDAPLESRDVAGMTLALSRHAGGPPEPSEDAVLRHAHVVEELSRTGAAVLPARFGLLFADEVALQRAVREHGDELRAGLERVRGCVELGLRVLLPEGKDEPAGVAGGGDYLRARLRETTGRERLARELHKALTGLAHDHTYRSPPSGQLLLSAAYLVPEGAVEPFRREVRKLEWSHPELALVCTGPWPPYSFAASTKASGTEGT